MDHSNDMSVLGRAWCWVFCLTLCGRAMSEKYDVNNVEMERIAEECTPKGFNLPHADPIRIGIKKRAESCPDKDRFTPLNTTTAKVKYHAWFFKNCSVFDAHFEETGLELTITQNEVPYMIKGFLKGLRGMCKGEVRRITVPSKWAYGRKGAAWIPGNSTLVYEVELESVTNSKEGYLRLVPYP